MLTGDAIRMGKHPSCKKTIMSAVPVQLTVDYLTMKFNELRKAAKAKGIKVPRGTKKSDLIKLLKGE